MISCAIRGSDSPFDRATLLDPASDSRSGRAGVGIGSDVEWRPNTISGSPLLFQRVLFGAVPDTSGGSTSVFPIKRGGTRRKPIQLGARA
jgi:hypothetical protein